MPPPRTLVAVRVGDGLLKMLGLCLLAGVLMAGMLFPVVGALGVVSNRASDTIDSVSADLVATDPPLITTITDSKGKPIAYLYDQYRVPVTPDQIAPTMKAALISVEDRRFYEHHGVDWKGTVRALISNQTGEDVQGASTLTQQYVKNYLINVVYRDQIGTDDADPGKKIEREPRAGADRHPQAAGGPARHPARAVDEQGGDPHRIPQRRRVHRPGVRCRRRGSRVLQDHARQADRGPVGAAGRHGQQPEPVQPVAPAEGDAGAAQLRHRQDGRDEEPVAGERGGGEEGAARHPAQPEEARRELRRCRSRSTASSASTSRTT